MLFTWEKKYNTGLEKVDYQHKKLVDLINKLHDEVVLNQDASAVQEIILDLKLYTIFHFTTEEKLFKKYNYEGPDHKHHLDTHKAFIEKISGFMGDNSSSQFELGYRIAEYLKKWLAGHILKTDMDFARFMKQNHFSEITSDDIIFDDDSPMEDNK